MWNKIVNIATWSVGIIILFVMLGSAISASNQSRMLDVKVDLRFGEHNFFIKDVEVREVVNDLGYLEEFTPMVEIDPQRIERTLENNPYIQDAEVYDEINGVLHVDVKVRQPVLRVFNTRGNSVYIDEQGKLMPLSDVYTARTPVANGFLAMDLTKLVGHNIKDLCDSLDQPELYIVKDLFEVVNYCRKDPFWKAQFNQFYVNADREIEIIPRVGDHIILLGAADDMDKKLQKLALFYERGLNKTGWNEYKTINLKYASQVVCTKS